MISKKQIVYDALSAALAPVKVHFFYPAKGAEMPCVSFYEAENGEDTRTDGMEHLTILAYVVDVWDFDPMKVATLAQTVHDALAPLCFKRAFSHDLYEADSKIHHTTMRFTAKADRNGRLWQ